MAQAARHRSPLSRIGSLLNSDGRAHPVENGFAAATIVLGLVAVVTAQFHGLHILSSWTGLIGIVTGAWGQMISATTAERFLLIVGLGAAALGFFLGMAHGGLFGGMFG
ncbi:MULTISPECIES: hypothetical protein [Streptomyces]|uniref:Integral membrane protein n=1 Tax=Streptomyces lycii TaxID=2654337 RepID=A0ABQ7FCD6_9ACTN|nr:MULTISPECIES: hypothetical protein [Streptomyces]KAF4406019.1 hypothetical protein GCU69_26875 [Streptomyces lycii]PGH49360.1 hypothetical protein CRI70_18055 [Streptomyces sp. Ru87]